MTPARAVRVAAKETWDFVKTANRGRNSTNHKPQKRDNAHAIMIQQISKNYHGLIMEIKTAPRFALKNQYLAKLSV